MERRLREPKKRQKTRQLSPRIWEVQAKRQNVLKKKSMNKNVGGRTPRARKPKKKEMRRAEKESLDREKTLNSERVRKQCVGKR